MLMLCEVSWFLSYSTNINSMRIALWFSLCDAKLMYEEERKGGMLDCDNNIMND